MGQPGRGASFKCLPVDLDSRYDSWSCWLQPISLLEEERDERVNSFLQEFKQPTKRALCTWRLCPSRLRLPGKSQTVQREQQAGSLRVSEPAGVSDPSLLRPDVADGQAEAQKPAIYLRPSWVGPWHPGSPSWCGFTGPSAVESKQPPKGEEEPRGERGSRRRRRKGGTNAGVSLSGSHPWFLGTAGAKGAENQRDNPKEHHSTS